MTVMFPTHDATFQHLSVPNSKLVHKSHTGQCFLSIAKFYLIHDQQGKDRFGYMHNHGFAAMHSRCNNCQEHNVSFLCHCRNYLHRIQILHEST